MAVAGSALGSQRAVPLPCQRCPASPHDVTRAAPPPVPPPPSQEERKNETLIQNHQLSAAKKQVELEQMGVNVAQPAQEVPLQQPGQQHISPAMIQAMMQQGQR